VNVVRFFSQNLEHSQVALLSISSNHLVFEVGIEQDRLKNQNLKNVQNAERELRDVRDKQETVLLKSAQQSQDDSMKWTKVQLENVQDSEKRIEQHSQALRKAMSER
jgi:hypothetical protein